MASSEPGPELDRRVGEAMGKGPVMVLDCYPEHLCFAPYSTDPARIAEMSAWLLHTGYPVIYPLGEVVRAYLQGHPESSEGQTIQHALALLVVAVGASDGE